MCTRNVQKPDFNLKQTDLHCMREHNHIKNTPNADFYQREKKKEKVIHENEMKSVELE